MLFATRTTGAQDVVDDIKIDVQGDVLPQDLGYPGLTFFDRGPGGVVMGCHNAKGGATFAGLGDVWTLGWGLLQQNSSPCYQSSGKMPTSIDWYGTPLVSGSGVGPQIGKGGVLGMPRTDGLTDNVDVIQGVRTYDSTAGTWTTPDVAAGIVEDPVSQKGYVWNGNNPESYSDPSGYDYATVGFDAEQSVSGEAHAIISEPEEQEADRELVDKGDLSQFYTPDDGAYAAAYKYQSTLNSIDHEDASSEMGVPEIGVGIYGSTGHIYLGSLQFGYYDSATHTPTIDIDTSPADYDGMWHGHPVGGDELELFGHIKNLTNDPSLKAIYTTVGHDLFKQWYDNQSGTVLPGWGNTMPPIPPLCNNCL